MDTLRNSNLYHLYTLLTRWLSHQWEESTAVTWLTHQPDSPRPGVVDRAQDRLHGLFLRLHLDKLLSGSLFLHPMLFVAAAILLAPLVPTMVVLGLVAGGFFSLLLSWGMGRERLSGDPLSIYVLLYAAIYLYATFTSVSLSGSLFPGLLTAAFVLFYFVTVSCDWTYQRLRQLVSGIVLVGLLVSAYGFYQLLFPTQFRSVWTDTDMFSTITFRVYSTLENPNVLGEYLLLVIPFAVALLLTADSWKKRVLWLGACGVLVVCLVVTYSRGCYLGLLFAAVIFLVLLDRRFLILGIVAVALSPLYLPESVLTRFTSIGDMADSSTSFRVYIWMGTLAMLKDYWFCGVGPGTEAFNLVYPNYAYSAIEAPHSHNLYLQTLCDTGVVGLGLFLMLLVCAYRMLFTGIRRTTDRSCRIFQIAGVAALSGFLLQSMTDYTFYNYRVMFLFWAVLGLCAVLCRKSEVSP
jgi:putative inorganic carbon (HCO3(-)) transporter